MQSTLIRRAQYGMQNEGHHGMGPWKKQIPYETYRSPYGPEYKVAPNYHGVSLGRFTKFAITAGGFGAVAGTFALFFFSDVPKIRKDIMQKIPIIGDYFVKEVPPEDSPF